MKRRDLLEAVQDCTDRFGSLTSGGAVRKREIERVMRAGLVRCIGIVELYDEWENLTGRSAPGYVLTETGKKALVEAAAGAIR